MEEIKDPWHSRPLDVHRWSDHPEVVEFVDKTWDEYLPKEMVGKPGPKPKQLMLHLIVLICKLTNLHSSCSDLFQCAHQEPQFR